jgi:hypothetical protein
MERLLGSGGFMSWRMVLRMSMVSSCVDTLRSSFLAATQVPRKELVKTFLDAVGGGKCEIIQVMDSPLPQA